MFLVIKVYKNYVHVCYVVVYQDGEGAPSHFGLWYSVSKLAIWQWNKACNFTMKYDQNIKGIKITILTRARFACAYNEINNTLII